MAGELSMKPVTLDWAGVSDAEAALVSRCLAGDEPACSELVESHQRMELLSAVVFVLLTVVAVVAREKARGTGFLANRQGE